MSEQADFERRATHWATAVSVFLYVGIIATGMVYFIFFNEPKNRYGCEWVWAEATPGPTCVIVTD